MARLFHVCGVGKQRQHTLFAQFAEAGQIHHFALYRRDVDLIVAGVDNHAYGRVYGQRHSVGNTVVNMNKFNIEAAKSESVPRLFSEYLSVFQQVAFIQLKFDNCIGQSCRVYRHIQFAYNIRYGAYVILMSVGYYYAADLADVCLQI